jgi:hypothetical protein
LNNNVVTKTLATLETYITAILAVVVVVLAVQYRRLTKEVKEKVGIPEGT